MKQSSMGGNLPIRPVSETIERVTKKLARSSSKLLYTPAEPPVHILDEDWDNLIILDACRYDQFEKINNINGELKAKNSLGSATPEFLRNNFAHRTASDTVYVTANPMYQAEGLNNIFHDVVDVWESDWDAENNTVHPEKVVKRSVEAYEAYPNKRLLIHFMQPHCPFIGAKSGEKLDHAGFEDTFYRAKGENKKRQKAKVWEMLRKGDVSKSTVEYEYDENLRLVLGYTKELIDIFDERTIITSDHGNLLGEGVGVFKKPMYGHPANVYKKELRKVPWLVIKRESRKNIITGSVSEPNSRDSQLVEDRLSDLGYV